MSENKIPPFRYPSRDSSPIPDKSIKRELIEDSEIIKALSKKIPKSMRDAKGVVEDRHLSPTVSFNGQSRTFSKKHPPTATNNVAQPIFKNNTKSLQGIRGSHTHNHGG
ncbi:MAG: hypothetical protein HW387_608 [Parachlamydiales bacterium]|nr:hypothetical protein [Parachlamydiales bacterium]